MISEILQYEKQQLVQNGKKTKPKTFKAVASQKKATNKQNVGQTHVVDTMKDLLIMKSS